MNNQDWFEKFKVRFGLDMDNETSQDQIWINEEWNTWESALVNMAVMVLPPLEKKIIQLIFYQKLPVREVAKKLKMPKSTVQDIKRRALKLLSKSIFIKFAFLPRRQKQRAVC